MSTGEKGGNEVYCRACSRGGFLTTRRAGSETCHRRKALEYLWRCDQMTPLPRAYTQNCTEVGLLAVGLRCALLYPSGRGGRWPGELRLPGFGAMIDEC